MSIYNELECPVCGGQKKNKKNKTCSYACSNTLFRSGTNNPNWKQSTYRTTCFDKHEKKCIVRGFDHIVEVHHVDEDRLNNHWTNLVPLCPNHHQMFHSRHRDEIQASIDAYLETLLVSC